MIKYNQVEVIYDLKNPENWGCPIFPLFSNKKCGLCMDGMYKKYNFIFKFYPTYCWTNISSNICIYHLKLLDKPWKLDMKCPIPLYPDKKIWIMHGWHVNSTLAYLNCSQIFTDQIQAGRNHIPVEKSWKYCDYIYKFQNKSDVSRKKIISISVTCLHNQCI